MSLSLTRKRNRSGGVGDSQNESVALKRRNCSNDNLTQNSRLSQSQHLEEDSRRCGKILHMRLTNFMCHSNLAIDFHPRVNFLVGSNGSGKSAILAALVLGLGGKAKETNRSNSVKGFIKNGETTSKIEIVLANNGPQPFEPETFGEKITIVRTITTTSGSYTIKNENGSVVSKKTDDLHRILLYHNVQVDNPVFVLNQDSAREFLKELEPSKNYTLFLKATQIDIVEKRLNECLHLHRAHMHELEIYKTKLNNQRNDIQEHEKKLEEIKLFEKLKDDLLNLEIAHAWLLVAEKESSLKDIDKKMENYQKQEEDISEKLQKKDQLNLVLNEEIRKSGEQVTKLKNDYQHENMKFNEIKSNYDEHMKLLSEYREVVDSLEKKKSRIEKQMKDINQHIDECSKGNQEDVDALRAQNEIKIAEYRNQCEKSLIPMIENLKREIKLLSDNKSQKEQIVNEIKRKQRECMDKIRLKNSQIGNIKASVKNKLLIYGGHMPDLIDEIKRAHAQGQFSQLPRGPIGSYIEVPRSQYRDVIENIIGRTILNAFIVNKSEDRQVLQRILAKYSNSNPVIITTEFRNQVYNVSEGCVHPPPNTISVMNEIKCSDSVVMNCLIDRIQIETVLLTNSKEVAENITSIYENVPRNLNKIIVIGKENVVLEYYPMPKYRMYSTRIKQANFIQVNIDERIRLLVNEKSTLEKEYKKFEDDLNHIGKQIPEDMKNIQEKRGKLQQNEYKLNEIEENISELQNVEYTDYNTQIKYLKKEFEENKIKLEQVEGKLEQERSKCSDLDVEEKRLDQLLKTQKKTLEQISNEIETLQFNSHELKIKIRSINDNEPLIREKLAEVKANLNKIQLERNELRKSIEIDLKKAKERGERVDTDIALDDMEDKIAQIKGQLKRGMATNIDPNNIRKLIVTKKEAFEADAETFENIKLSIKMLRKSLQYRFDFIKKLKEHMAIMLQLSFSMILKLRNFEGTIDIDHQKKTLKISVIPRDHNKNAVSNTKSLSGGERSYSTVAFLISLWSCVDHPFYFLDEYDVFTDDINREYMTRLLIDEGRKRVIRQYSFLTPQDMTLVPEEFIKIHRLQEPDRR